MLTPSPETLSISSGLRVLPVGRDPERNCSRRSIWRGRIAQAIAPVQTRRQVQIVAPRNIHRDQPLTVHARRRCRAHGRAGLVGLDVAASARPLGHDKLEVRTAEAILLEVSCSRGLPKVRPRWIDRGEGKSELALFKGLPPVRPLLNLPG